jgi:hypothetical protein
VEAPVDKGSRSDGANERDGELQAGLNFKGRISNFGMGLNASFRLTAFGELPAASGVESYRETILVGFVDWH